MNSWILEYVKGINLTRHTLGSATYNAGTSPVSVDVNGNAMVAGVTSTCAFALLLRAWSHVRGDSLPLLRREGLRHRHRALHLPPTRRF